VTSSSAGPTGLRERKRQRTMAAICHTALTLMLERGFDKVSVSDIAAAAEVSTMTVFNYFPTKEDIILAQVDDHFDESARVVASRPAGQAPLAALRAHFLGQIAAGDPAVGVSGDERVVTYTRLVVGTPSLLLRYTDRQLQSQESLARALAEVPGTTEITAEAAAAQIVGVQRALGGRNLDRILGGADPAEVRATAAAEAGEAFDLLEQGLRVTPLATSDPGSPAGRRGGAG
jgi:AcrR family transcriptional regulator